MRAAETAQKLWAFAVCPELPCWVAHNCLLLQFHGIEAPSGPLGKLHTLGTFSHRRIHVYIIKTKNRRSQSGISGEEHVLFFQMIQVWFCKTHVRQLTTNCNSSSLESDTSDFLEYLHIWTYSHTVVHICIIKENKSKSFKNKKSKIKRKYLPFLQKTRVPFSPSEGLSHGH